MQLQIARTTLQDIQAFRLMFLQEHQAQFVCDKCHYYGWSDDYLFLIDGEKIGYGCVWGTNRREDRDTIFEFYLLPSFRKFSHLVFPEFHVTSAAVLIECQSNDALLSTMLFEYATNILAEAILFEDHLTTNLVVHGAIFRKKNEEDDMGDDESDFVLEWNDSIVATGGLMLNYNFPYADIYMGVKEGFRLKGFGSLIVQELKKEAYRVGRVPAARCNINNPPSKSTLLKAGLRVCGFRLKGDIKK